MGHLVILSVMVAVLISQPVDRGSADQSPEDMTSLRRSPRLRLLAGGAGQVNWVPNLRVTGGVGARAEVGITLLDVVAISATGTATTLFTDFSVSAGIAIDVFLGDHFSVGAGVAYASWIPPRQTEPQEGAPSFSGFLFPVHVSWAPFGRAANEVGGSGLVVQLHAGPGVNPTFDEYPPGYGLTRWAATFEISIAWTTW